MRESIVRAQLGNCLDEVTETLQACNDADLEKLCSELIATRGSLHMYGSGRSGLAAQMGAMRMMHVGLWKSVHAVGEVTAPSIGANDVLLVISNSGERRSTNYFAAIAAKAGARIFSIVGARDTELTRLSDCTLLLDVPLTERFGGSTFEEASVLLLDVMAQYLQEIEGVSSQEMWRRHTNLE